MVTRCNSDVNSDVIRNFIRLHEERIEYNLTNLAQPECLIAQLLGSLAALQLLKEVATASLRSIHVEVDQQWPALTCKSPKLPSFKGHTLFKAECSASFLKFVVYACVLLQWMYHILSYILLLSCCASDTGILSQDRRASWSYCYSSFHPTTSHQNISPTTGTSRDWNLLPCQNSGKW